MSVSLSFFNFFDFFDFVVKNSQVNACGTRRRILEFGKRVFQNRFICYNKVMAFGFLKDFLDNAADFLEDARDKAA
ncbi:MAG: hypothetical protein LBK05_01830, partial [Treponema sp.]|nr:hypothetical protein [Treponema sp.]